MHEGHVHEHAIAPMGKGEAEAMLEYMLKHNAHHARELDELAISLGAMGFKGASDEVLRSARAFREGNEGIEKAIKLIKEG